MIQGRCESTSEHTLNDRNLSDVHGCFSNCQGLVKKVAGEMGQLDFIKKRIIWYYLGRCNRQMFQLMYQPD